MSGDFSSWCIWCVCVCLCVYDICACLRVCDCCVYVRALDWFDSYLSSGFFCECVWILVLLHPSRLWRTPTLSIWPYTFQNVHSLFYHPYFVFFTKSPPLCRWHTTLYIFLFPETSSLLPPNFKTLSLHYLCGCLPTYSLSIYLKLN